MTENPQSSDSYAFPDGNMRPARESMHQIHRAIDARACNAMAEILALRNLVCFSVFYTARDYTHNIG